MDCLAEGEKVDIVQSWGMVQLHLQGKGDTSSKPALMGGGYSNVMAPEEDQVVNVEGGNGDCF